MQVLMETLSSSEGEAVIYAIEERMDAIEAHNLMSLAHLSWRLAHPSGYMPVVIPADIEHAW